MNVDASDGSADSAATETAEEQAPGAQLANGTEAAATTAVERYHRQRGSVRVEGKRDSGVEWAPEDGFAEQQQQLGTGEMAHREAWIRPAATGDGRTGAVDARDALNLLVATLEQETMAPLPVGSAAGGVSSASRPTASNTAGSHGASSTERASSSSLQHQQQQQQQQQQHTAFSHSSAMPPSSPLPEMSQVMPGSGISILAGSGLGSSKAGGFPSQGLLQQQHSEGRLRRDLTPRPFQPPTADWGLGQRGEPLPPGAAEPSADDMTAGGGGGGSGALLTTRPSKVFVDGSAAAIANRQRVVAISDVQSASNFSTRATLGGNVDLSWHHVTVTLPADAKMKRPNPKVILDNINGRVEAGNLMALMGASGAGKTTFLNMISGRMASVLEAQGVFAINGHAASPGNIRRIAAYVQQQDVFLANLTVKEHLTIQAMLRMDNRVPQDERMDSVKSVMHELGLTKIADTRIGSPVSGTRGISGGEAKRLAFASEILTDPALLFADEPTSGLDSFASQSVIKSLVELANNGRTIICTIHQPPSEVFTLFHKLLLFADGRTAYLGNVSGAPAAFAELGYPCPPNYNHADFYIHTLAIAPGRESECRDRVKSITDAYREKEEASGAAQAPEEESKVLAERLKEMSGNRGEAWYVQFAYIMWRSWLSATREFQVIGVQLMQTIVMAVLFGTVFWQIGECNGLERQQNTAGALVMVVAAVSFQTLYPVIQVLPVEVVTLIRDNDNRMYRTWVFFVSKLIADIPIQVIYLLFYCLISYFMIGLRVSASHFFTYYGVLAGIMVDAKALGFFISSIALRDTNVALSMVPPFGITLFLFSGLFVNSDAIPVFLTWLEALSFFKYGFDALMINEFGDRTLESCGNGTALVAFQSGDEILARLSLGKDTSDLGVDIAINVGIAGVLLLLSFIILVLRLRFLKR